jgi:hypothetical protein
VSSEFPGKEISHMSSSLAHVESSRLTLTFKQSHANVEVWPDADFHEGGFDYFWICNNADGIVRNLAYVRVKPGVFEKRSYDQEGDDLWVAAH